ncbi:transporter substrate-binding domain-containing protein [Marinomonas ostreistagni]|uniref:histidine kinase n=1 Tax=Marinomonas ostreistagni TaxID=359209 RepID=A0ABS0Z8U7_9GAMM|nr:transporter substrate-binding domain-containing protein [Marinomonas ostreistagni]MBJ7550079.1 transporter substrate-binding domain-containing protein [Marinomonas ostreistagni]
MRTFILWLMTVLVSVSFAHAETRTTLSNTPKRVVHIAADYNYPPYEFLDEEGQPAGYTVELTYAIAETMGLDIDLTMTDWQSAYTGLLDGTYDVLQNIAYSEERAKHIFFSSPHSIVSQSLFARKDGPHVDDISEVSGYEVIVQNASIMHEYLKQNFPEITIIPAPTHSAALRLLASGKHDFALTANSPSLYLSQEMGLSNLEPIARPVAGQRLSYGALPVNEDLMALFSEGLAILKNTGRQQEIYNKWFGTLDQSKTQWKKLGQYAFYTILALLFILGGIMVWNSMLRKEVERRSEQIKAQQEQLIQADKMASLGVLVSGVAHEINNPTGLLMLNLPILRSAWEDALPYLDEVEQEHAGLSLGGLSYQRLKAEIPYLLDEMQHSTDRIRNIVNDLKDFAREQPDEIWQEVNINQVVETAVRLVDKSLRNATEDFTLHLDPRNPKILGNPQRLEQVIINLVLNACDALENKTQALTISTSLNPDQSELLLAVEDQGCGIDQQALPRLTDPFFTTKRETGGTGLGLSVSAGIVKAHKGRLSFESSVGKGTVAIASFPVLP